MNNRDYRDYSNYKKDKSNKRTIERDGIKKSPFCICKMEIFYED